MEQARSVVEGFIVGSPYGKHLGIVMESVEADRVCLRLPYREALTTIGDMVHGGAIASLVDVAATAACWASPNVDPASRGTTIGLTLNYLNAGRGQDLLATAEVIQRGRSIPFCEVTIRAGDTSVAKALVTYKLSGGK
ncbi:MAG: PaaI family thioesterase [Candidatus Binatia bacterium]